MKTKKIVAGLTGAAMVFGAFTAADSFAGHHEKGEKEVMTAVSYVGLLNAEDRSDADKERDYTRKPADILAKVNIHKGETVVDLGAGSGYYSEVFARAVGEKGSVYSINTPAILARFETITPALNARMEALPAKMEHIQAEFYEFPEADVNVVFMGQMYHEVILQEMDAAAINKAAYDALVPGGYYVIEIHRAKEGAGAGISGETHRADPAIVREQVMAAGFELYEENTDLLGNPDDPLDTLIFAEDIRGKTARTVFFFRKPN